MATDGVELHHRQYFVADLAQIFHPLRQPPGPLFHKNICIRKVHRTAVPLLLKIPL